MAHEDEYNVSDLDNAIKTIDENESGSWNSSISSAINIVLEATRDLNRRDYLNERDTLSKITRLSATVSEDTTEHGKEGRLKLLRCIGNLVADNDDNRTFIMADTACLKDLQKGMRIEAMQQGPDGIKRADTALSVLYNLCIDNAEIQQAALKKDLHISIFEYIHGRPWDFGEEYDEDLFENAILTLNEILQHKSEVNHPEHLTPKLTSEILRLPCVDNLLDVLFEAAALSILPYLKDANFQEAILDNRQLPLLWSLLEKAASIARVPNVETSEVPAVEKAVFETITGMSLLPSYPEHLENDYAFIRILCNACIHTENDTKTASTSTAACILLGNFATRDDAYASTVVSKLDLIALFNFLSLKAYGRSKASGQTTILSTSQDTPEPRTVPADAVYLHAAAGMLRHISKARHIRESHFTDPAALQASIALSQYSEAEVQIQGLRLFRHLVAIDMSTMTHSISNNYPTSLIKVFTASSNERVKLEVSRTVVRILRALVTKEQEPSPPEISSSTATNTHATTAQDDEKRTGREGSSSSRPQLLQSFLATPDLIEPLLFAVNLKRPQDPHIDFARAEGWFGLVLLKLAGSTEFLRPKEVLDALLDVLVDDAMASGTETEEQRRVRDNAVAFAAEVIKDVHVDSGLRGDIQSLLAEAGIDVR